MAIATVAIALAAILIAPKAVGGQSFSVLSGSMAPAVNTGDMVVVVPERADAVRVGQIVAFNDPDGSGRLYQHRVQSVREDNGQVIVVTKGDANNTGEHWQAPVDSDVGRVVVVVPHIGWVVGHVTGGKPIDVLGREVPMGTLALALMLFALAAVVIAGILRSSSPEETATSDDNPAEELEFIQHRQEEGQSHA
ncbi:MAG: signal peptidase I [Solirubrobacterales bacterium]|nr:signal peptidase I [Solirubrobacterales bacterium]